QTLRCLGSASFARKDVSAGLPCRDGESSSSSKKVSRESRFTRNLRVLWAGRHRDRERHFVAPYPVPFRAGIRLLRVAYSCLPKKSHPFVILVTVTCVASADSYWQP